MRKRVLTKGRATNHLVLAMDDKTTEGIDEIKAQGIGIMMSGTFSMVAMIVQAYLAANG